MELLKDGEGCEYGRTGMNAQSSNNLTGTIAKGLHCLYGVFGVRLTSIKKACKFVSNSSPGPVSIQF